jgi:hypothetical protein
VLESFEESEDGIRITKIKTVRTNPKNIIEKFSMSPPHNEALLLELNEGSKFSVGISSIIDNEIVFTTIYFIEELEE